MGTVVIGEGDGEVCTVPAVDNFDPARFTPIGFLAGNRAYLYDEAGVLREVTEERVEIRPGVWLERCSEEIEER